MTKLSDRIGSISLQQQSPRFTPKPRPLHRVPAPRAPRKPVMFQVQPGRPFCQGFCCSSTTQAGKRSTSSPIMGPRTGGDSIGVTQSQNVFISPVNSALAFHFPFTLFSKTYSFLVDTGAAATLLSSTTWNHYLQQCCYDLIHPSLESVSSCLFGVNGSRLTVKCNISLQSNQFNFPISAIVVDDLAEEAIMGLDFLEKYSGTRCASEEVGPMACPKHFGIHLCISFYK